MPTSAAACARAAGCDRALGFRELVGRRGIGHMAHEGLEAGRRRDHEPVRLLRLDAVGVREPTRRERRLAGADGHLLFAGDEQRHLAVEHEERLVVAVMDVQGRHVAAPPPLFDDREPPVAGLPVDVDVDEVVDEPQ